MSQGTNVSVSFLFVALSRVRVDFDSPPPSHVCTRVYVYVRVYGTTDFAFDTIIKNSLIV